MGFRRSSQFLLVRRVRKRVGRLRLWYYLRLRRRWSSIDSEDAFDRTVEHNARQLRNFGNDRMFRLIRPVSAIETLNPDSRVLVIGPRNENDLLILKGYGFRDVRGLDLFSYSPWIDVGDMHELPYADGAFDAVLCGWTLSYSKEPRKAADEIGRVTRPGGVIGVAVEFQQMAYADRVARAGYSVEDQDFERINSVEQILALFPGRVQELFFSHDAPRRRGHSREGDVADPSAVIAVFGTPGA